MTLCVWLCTGTKVFIDTPKNTPSKGGCYWRLSDASSFPNAWGRPDHRTLTIQSCLECPRGLFRRPIRE